MTTPAGMPGHGNGNTSIRAQPAHLYDTNEGRRWNGQTTGAYEVICHSCGDNPDLNYSETSPDVQRVRGPYASIESAKTALLEHIGMSTRTV